MPRDTTPCYKLGCSSLRDAEAPDARHGGRPYHARQRKQPERVPAHRRHPLACVRVRHIRVRRRRRQHQLVGHDERVHRAQRHQLQVRIQACEQVLGCKRPWNDQRRSGPSVRCKLGQAATS